MQQTLVTGTILALGTGLAIGLQAILFTVIGRAIGPVRGSLILNVIGGVVAGIILAVVMGLRGREQWDIPGSTLLAAVIAVSIGIAIVMGVSLSFQQVGASVGIATLFLGQMLIGIVADSLGWTGGEPVPLDLRRIIGLMVMGVAVVLLVYQGES